MLTVLLFPRDAVMLTRRQTLAALPLFGAAPLLGRAEDPPKTSPPRKFQLGLVTYNVAATWDLPTILKVCSKVGIAAVECRTSHKHGVEPGMSAEKIAETKKRFADSGVKFWGCGSACEFHSPDPKVVAKNVEECKRFVELTAALGGMGVKVRPNGLQANVAKTADQIGTALKACGDAAKDAGIEICVEVHGKGSQDPKFMRMVMDSCGHPSVGVTWNSNPTDVKEGSIAESFETLKPFIKSCHITNLYDEKYPYRDLFARFRTMGYDRFTMIEVGKTFPDPALGEEFLRYYKMAWEQLTAAA